MAMILFLLAAVIYTFSFSEILKFRYDFNYIADEIDSGNVFISFTYSFNEYSNDLVYESIIISGLITVVFIVAILALVFWPKSKGVYGDAHFASITEIANSKMFSKNGIHLGKISSRYIINDEPKHVLVVGPTRSGKGVGFVIPNLLKWQGSSICLDLKQENYNTCSGALKAEGNEVYLFAPGQYDSHCYNPLDYISKDQGKRVTDIQALVEILIPTVQGSGEEWNRKSRGLFQGLISFVLESIEHEKQQTLGQVMRLLMTGTDTSNFLKWAIQGDEFSEFTKMNINNFCNTADKERSGIKSGVTSALQIWQNPIVDAATSRSDFDIRNFRKTKTNIFVGVKAAEKKALSPLLNLFFQQSSNILSQEIPGNDEPHKVLFMIDEFYSLGNMKVILDMMPFVAGYNLKLALIIQNLSQLDDNYGHNGRDIILGNSAIQLFLGFNDQTTANYVSSALGNKTISTKSASKRKASNSMMYETTYNTSQTGVPLMRPEELRRLKPQKQIILLEGAEPIFSNKIRYFKDKRFKDLPIMNNNKKIAPFVQISSTPDAIIKHLEQEFENDSK